MEAASTWLAQEQERAEEPFDGLLGLHRAAKWCMSRRFLVIAATPDSRDPARPGSASASGGLPTLPSLNQSMGGPSAGVPGPTEGPWPGFLRWPTLLHGHSARRKIPRRTDDGICSALRGLHNHRAPAGSLDTLPGPFIVLFGGCLPFPLCLVGLGLPPTYCCLRTLRRLQTLRFASGLRIIGLSFSSPPRRAPAFGLFACSLLFDIAVAGPLS